MERDQSNKLAMMPMNKLLVSMSLPMMVSFFIQALYNIVDSMFVAKLSEDALTAVSLAFPVQQVITAIGVGTGVGVNALVPRYMGQGEPRKANLVANTAVLLCICYSVVFLILGLTIVSPYYQVQTNVASIADGGITYLTIVVCVSAGVFFGQIFEKLLVCNGYSTLAMLSQASGAVFNLVFDPLLIFGLGPFPRMGIAGAALATVLGQILGALIAFILNLKRNPNIRFRWLLLRPNGMVVSILSVGFPSMITMGLSSATTFCVNQILLLYSTTATAVYGIWMKLQNFCYMPVFGMNNGMVPILSYNLGNKRYGRIREAIRLAVISILGLMVTLAVIFELIPDKVLAMFSASETMTRIGLVALRFCCCALPFGALCVIFSSSMQALGYARWTLVVNILRQFVLLVVLFGLFHLLFHNLDVLWAAVPLAECISCLLAIFLARRMLESLKR
ncbi:MAG: MATE family efflux transporter [Sphaerochaetaceae bacterium]|nr:MATE family efflux transporter [Spirochaetales bacterium]MDY5500077.1 MATE family efflux transporter [Sphaerochaetaceae bacterium]